MALHSSRGQLHLQFNWIFVIIVGAILLGFLFSLTSTQTSSAQKAITASTARQLNTIITSTAQQPGTFKTFSKVPERELAFYCNEQQGLSHYEIDSVRAGTTTHDVIFTPRQFIPETIYTWTLDWTIPYRVSVFTYISDEDRAFIFYNNDSDGGSYFDEFYARFPKNMTHIVYNESSIQYFDPVSLGYDHYTYIFFDPQNIPDQFEDRMGEPEPNELFINISPSSDTHSVFSYGEVSFKLRPSAHEARLLYYSRDYYNQWNTASYFGSASLYGAVFSGSKEIFECTMSKAYDYFELYTQLQLRRVQQLLPDVSSRCNRLLGGGIDDGIPRAQQLLNNTLITLNESAEEIDVEDLYEYTTSLEDINYKLAMEGDCPLVY